MDIWNECQGQYTLQVVNGELFRVVESQESIATNNLVDDLAEQAILESLIETTKPPVPENGLHLHYLLFTPFRYPPLPYGSRFGSRHEPGIFYCARNLITALAEAAYYRFVFWLGMSVAPPSAKLTTQHNAFTALFYTTKGLKLQLAPFSDYTDQLSSRSSYSDTQPLGSAMRNNDIEAFEYISARDKNKGINIGLFYPNVLKSKKPTSVISLICTTQADVVQFMDDENRIYAFERDQFMSAGEFPMPSAQ
jgi:hypothetical protein